MNSDLNKEKCKPCSGNAPKLSRDEISKYLSELNNWIVNDDNEMIYKKFQFNNYNKALNFTNLVSQIAEKEGHHPDISLGWGYVIVMLHTHAIKGLSLNDFILATKIDNIK
tara:strand:+ start:8825 stop:9157 length:333 start_codon:yes stop_codon:yes gene_type:complete